MYSKTILIGNLGKDPELKEHGETNICNFSIATTHYGKGEKQTTWHNVTCFNKIAENVAQYLKKGSKAFIEGRIDVSEHEGKYYTKIIANNVQFLDSKEKGESNDSAENNFGF